MNLLVYDDQNVIAHLVRAALCGRHHRVALCADPAEAQLKLDTGLFDAMIIGPGRIGTLNEFSVSFEDRRPIGVLEGSWKTDEFLREVIDAAHRPNDFVVFDSDPKALVERLIQMVQKIKERNMVFDSHDGWSATGKGAEVIL